MNNFKTGKNRGWIILVSNLLCVAILFAVFYYYQSDYELQFYDQNLNDIINLNQSSVNVAQFYFDNQKQELCNIAQYLSRTKMNYQQVADFIYDSNANQARSYELIGADNTGILIKKDPQTDSYETVNYTHSTYTDIINLFSKASEENQGTVDFTPEFTDNYTAKKSFAIFTYVRILDENENAKYYTLLSVSKSSDFIDMIQLDGGYDEMSSVLFDNAGNYIIGNSDFKSSGIFKYIYKFNDLTLDQKNELSKGVLSSDSGVFTYNNSLGKKCVYVYKKAENGKWYCITVVPNESFHKTNTDFGMTIFMIIVLLTMFTIDVLWLNVINRRMKLSMLHEMQANNAKTEFLSRMSHDLRTPLNGIIGVSQLAQYDMDQKPLMEQHVSDINTTARFMLGLVNDILDMSKIESGELMLSPEPYCHNEIARDIKTMFSPICAQKDQELIIDTGEYGDTYMLADKQRLKQIIFNLISNAAKFTPTGGRIEFSIAEQTLVDGKIHNVFLVRDNGIGISKEFQSRMYNSFSQEVSDSNSQGTGLGLAITKSLVEIMGGQIECTSDLGKGTTFEVSIDFVLYTQSEREKDGQKIKYNFDGLKGKHILLCEDNILNAKIAIRILEREGMIVDNAENGKDGVEMFAASAVGDYDAIIMDMRMPVMDGLEATGKIRALKRDDAKKIPIIAMTANAFQEDIDLTKKAGMNAHLAKPVEPQHLYETLVKYITQ